MQTGLRCHDGRGSRTNWTILLGALVSFCACADQSTTHEDPGYGRDPELPAPRSSLIPVVKVAPAKGWTGDERPTAAQGLSVNSYTSDLDHPRWLYVLPNGDVLVAETNAPEDRPDDRKRLRDKITLMMMKRAGAGVPSANRITLLRDADGDGTAEQREEFLRDLNSPFGMALIGTSLYVANTDALMRFPYRDGAVRISEPGTRVADLPAGPINHHWTKNVIANRDGSRLYVTVGSNSNIAENGMQNEEHRAAILEIDPASGQSRVFAWGLRNPNGLHWQPQTGALWTAVNERDELGDNLVPDYITSVREGGFYGWPYSYYGQHVDARVQPQNPELVARAITPDYAVGSHTASLGLVFYDADRFPAHYHGGAFVGQHGSWNRKPPSGYKVIFVPFKDGQPDGKPEDVLTGFLDAEGNARGRPVGVAVDGTGALLVADDVGNRIWRVVPAP